MFDDEGLMPVITSVTVSASCKAWAGSVAVVSGESVETDLSLTSEPTGHGRAWTRPQAQKVILMLRKELQRLLVVDARVRQVNDPPGGEESLVRYDEAIASIAEE